MGEGNIIFLKGRIYKYFYILKRDFNFLNVKKFFIEEFKLFLGLIE